MQKQDWVTLTPSINSMPVWSMTFPHKDWPCELSENTFMTNLSSSLYSLFNDEILNENLHLVKTYIYLVFLYLYEIVLRYMPFQKFWALKYIGFEATVMVSNPKVYIVINYLLNAYCRQLLSHFIFINFYLFELLWNFTYQA